MMADKNLSNLITDFFRDYSIPSFDDVANMSGKLRDLNESGRVNPTFQRFSLDIFSGDQ